MVRGKKSQVLMYGLIAGLIGAIIVVLISSPSNVDVIGDSSFRLIFSQKFSEKVFLYIDQSAKYSLENTIKTFAENGGISEIDIMGSSETYSFHECGKYNGAAVWAIVEKAGNKYDETYCFEDEIINDSFINEFKSELDSYLESSPYNIPLNNYDFEITGALTVIGKAANPIIINIYDKPTDEEIIKSAQTKNPKEIAATAKDFKESSTSPTTKNSENLKDFTGSAICAKGSNCILTQEAVEIAIKAQEIANLKGKTIEIYSAYRSKEKQQALWDGKTSENFAKRYPDESIRDNYVCNPKGGEKSCPHMSGKVVDARLKGKTTKTMTSDDWNLLYSIMKEAGWVGYSNEPWHFECCGTDRYARAKTQGVSSIV